MAFSSRQTLSAPAEELTNAILYVENHQQSETHTSSAGSATLLLTTPRMQPYFGANTTRVAVGTKLDPFCIFKGSSGRLLDMIEIKWETVEKRVQYQVDSEFCAPYTTLVQASGTGKMKLLHKTAESVKAVYCCLREENSSSHPARSYIANKLLGKSKDANSVSICGTHLAYLVACIEHLQQSEAVTSLGFNTKSTQEEFWKVIES
ncbi:11001_t:CDS:2 [Paraglomus brasilianum]|uniref:11001_t:CDS:1 n=1 Tax=Paraglomus brasilianum TaxID=144538 RepID=A0A9N9GXC3_9GLOM|nr:11001_t:CDS:2 [Paraglomus brasilianum]